MKSVKLAADLPMFAGIFGGWETVLVLAVVLILVGARKLPELARGLREGVFRVRGALDEAAREAGESIGGIYGKQAAQALTPDNQTAELYDPAVLRKQEGTGGRSRRWRWRVWITACRRCRRLGRWLFLH